MQQQDQSPDSKKEESEKVKINQDQSKKKTEEEAEEEFFVHHNHPLAIIKLNKKLFANLLPWLFDSHPDSFANKVVLKALKSSVWKNKFINNITPEDRARTVSSLKTLPFLCFSVVTEKLSNSQLPAAPIKVVSDIFKNQPSQWVSITTTDLLIAMRLILEYSKTIEKEQSGRPSILPNENPLPVELLDRELDVTHTIFSANHGLFTIPPLSWMFIGKDRPEKPHPEVVFMTLTLRRLIGMLTGLGFVTDRANSQELEVKHIYVADAANSPYFIIHQKEISKRLDMPEWRVVVRNGEIYSPRISSIDLMRDLYKHLEDTMITLNVIGDFTI
jgi:hypothetical protein